MGDKIRAFRLRKTLVPTIQLLHETPRLVMELLSNRKLETPPAVVSNYEQAVDVPIAYVTDRIH